MPKQPIEDYKIRLMVLREWKKNSTLNDAVKNINSNPKIDQISKYFVAEWYQRFENGDFNVFEKNSRVNVLSSQFESPKNLTDSIFLLAKDGFNRMITKDGRFFVLFCGNYGSKFLILYDTFHGTQRINRISFQTNNVFFNFIGKYLIAFESFDSGFYKYHLLKINYDDLSIEEGEAIGTNPNFDYYMCNAILTDQLNEEKLAICFNIYEVCIGQIKNDRIVVRKRVMKLDFKNDPVYGMRLVDNLIQGFVQTNRYKGLKFFELNLNTKELKSKNVPIKFENNDRENNLSEYTDNFYWTKDYFYGSYASCYSNYILVFDPQTFKWTNVNIRVNSQIVMFVDESEMLRLGVLSYGEPFVFYKIALRTPDKLMNLTRSAAVKESEIYGDKKYVKIARKIPIML